MSINQPLRELLGQSLNLEQERKIEGIVSELFSNLDDMTENEPMEVAARAVSSATVKAMLATLAKHGHLTDHSVNHAEFHQCVKWFAYELIAELRARSPRVLTDELIQDIAEAIQ